MTITRALGHAAMLAPLSVAPSASAFTCSPGPYVVFFDAGAAQIDGEGAKILEIARLQSGQCGSSKVFLTGHSDTKENPRLARKRGEVVRAFLVASGVPSRDIAVEAFGATRPRVATGPDVAERQNRRVELIYGPANPALP